MELSDNENDVKHEQEVIDKHERKRDHKKHKKDKKDKKHKHRRERDVTSKDLVELSKEQLD